MTIYPRLVAQLHQVEADSPAQADEIARIRADAVNAGMRVLGHGTAWAPTVADLDSEEGGLDDIVRNAYLLDEVDGSTGYVALDESPVFELLLAWRDAAVKAALDAVALTGWSRVRLVGGYVVHAARPREGRVWTACGRIRHTCDEPLDADTRVTCDNCKSVLESR